MTLTYKQYVKGMEELVMVPCSICDHVHGAHTWDKGCLGVTILNMMGFWTPHLHCDCPGFLSIANVAACYPKDNGKEEKGSK